MVMDRRLLLFPVLLGIIGLSWVIWESLIVTGLVAMGSLFAVQFAEFHYHTIDDYVFSKLTKRQMEIWTLVVVFMGLSHSLVIFGVGLVYDSYALSVLIFPGVAFFIYTFYITELEEVTFPTL